MENSYQIKVPDKTGQMEEGDSRIIDHASRPQQACSGP
jgi:hypothetical protein